MATYSVQSPSITGTTPTFSAVSSSDKVHYVGERSFLIVKNGGGSSVNVTVVVPGSTYGQANTVWVILGIVGIVLIVLVLVGRL